MEFREVLYGRRAVRDYLDSPVDRPTLESLIDAAVHAPNAMNRQSWRFVVATGRAELARWGEAARRHMLAHLDESPLVESLRDHLTSPEFQIFHGAPALVLICAHTEDTFATEDCCLAAQNLMLTAHDVGLGSCWIGLAEPWLRTSEGRRALAIPPSQFPIAPIIVGHPRLRLPSPPRNLPQITWIGA